MRTAWYVFVGSSLIGGVASMFVHHYSNASASVPISIELVRGNPFALTFIVATILAASSAAFLFDRRDRLAEAAAMILVATGVLTIAFTRPSSLVHLNSLIVAVLAANVPPLLAVLRRPNLILIVFLSASVAPALLILGELGYAERFWFFQTCFCNAYLFIRDEN